MPPQRDVLRRRPTRRALMAAAGGLALAASGCGGSRHLDPPSSGFTGTPVADAMVPGPSGRWAGRTLRVGAFGGGVERALRTLVWEPFAAHTGCAVEAASGGFAVATPAAASEAPAYGGLAPAADLLLMDPIAAAAGAARGEFAALRDDLVPTDAIGRSDAAHAAPALAYALVSAHRRGAFPDGAAPASWSEWWDAERFPGARSLGRSPVGSLEAALLADGVPPADLYPLDLDRALASLDRIAPAVGDRWWERGIEPVGWLGAGRAELATAWHHRVVAGQWDGLAIDLVWNQALLAVDRWVVPVDAREPEIALDLIAFALTPDRQAALARETRLGPVVPAAFGLIEPWLLPTIPTAPPHAAGLVPLDPAWWATERDAAAAEFARWLATVLR